MIFVQNNSLSYYHHTGWQTSTFQGPKRAVENTEGLAVNPVAFYVADDIPFENMTTVTTLAPTPTKFSNRKIEYCRGRPSKPEPIKNRPKINPISQRILPETDEEYLQYFQDRIINAQKRQLYPLQEDLADWLNKTLGIEYITADNFFDMLDNGVILCQLARVIHERAQYAIARGLHKGKVPELNGRCFENAARRSFFSRDNMENFITFCKQLGVHQNLLFESDDLVLQNQPRNVILCLLELSRITTKFNIEPPVLVELEKEIAEEEQKAERLNKFEKNPILSWQFRRSPNVLSSDGSVVEEPIRCKPLEGSDGVPSDHTEDDWSRGSTDDSDDIDGSQPSDFLRSPVDELDRKIQQATEIVQKQCHCDKEKCSKVSVKKVGDGKYNIAGRNVFVRLLKGRHMMVRVGGGWDTLEHFLIRHDPCQVRIMSRGSAPATVTPQRHSVPASSSLGSISNLQSLAYTSSPQNANAFLHIRAKYRSPPPP